MRILWWGDAGVHTGFGQVTHQIAERLVTEYGHDVSVLAINYRGDYYPTPLKLYVPTRDVPYDVYGQSRIVKLLADIVPEAIVILNDPAVVLNMLFRNPWDGDRVLWRGIKMPSGTVYRPPILFYAAMDGYDSPRSWDELRAGTHSVAMSHFGQTQMPEAPVVWHGVNTTVFHPRDRTAAKRKLGYDPKRFLVLRVDRNSIRKDFPATWKAMRPLLRKYQDIDLHFHCQTVTEDGYNLDSVRFNDEDIRDRVNFTPNLSGYLGVQDELLATLYAAADIFVSTSWAEGFGLTILEAMASGTPVVAQDCSAITEVVGAGGVLVPPLARISTPMGQDQCLPDVPAFTAAIEGLYKSRARRKALGAAAVEQAQKFSWDIAAERFDRELRTMTGALSTPASPSP